MHREKRRRSTWPLGCLLCLLLQAGLGPASTAGEPLRVYVRASAADPATLAAVRASFAEPLAAAGYAEMVEPDLGLCTTQDSELSADQQRACLLRAAQRTSVQHVAELTLTAQSAHAFTVVLTVWDPDSNGKVFGDMVVLEAPNAQTAWGVALPTLGAHYRCFLGDTRICPPDQAPDPTHVPSTPRVGAEQFAPEARQVAFPGREGERWILQDIDGSAACTLPCTRWVVPDGPQIRVLDADGMTLAEIPLPPWETGLVTDDGPLRAEIYLASDWQWQEFAAWASLIGGLGAMGGGIALAVEGDGGIGEDVGIGLAIGGLATFVFGTSGFLVHLQATGENLDRVEYRNADLGGDTDRASDLTETKTETEP